MSVLDYLQETARDLVLSDAEYASIERSISTLAYRLDGYFDEEDVEEHFEFGSSARGTMLPHRADPNSDVDYMVVFDNSEGWKPQTLLDRLRRFAQDCYQTSEVYQAHPTLVLNLNHVRFELVPAYRRLVWGLQIPAPASDFREWTGTDPKGHAERLDEADHDASGDVRAAVRLLKYWNASNEWIFPSLKLEQTILNTPYFFRPSLSRRLFDAIKGLPTWGLGAKKRDLIDRTREFVERTIDLEERDYGEYAEMEVEKVILPL